MSDGLNDLWGKLTPEEQKKLGEELHRMFQEEIDREIIRELKTVTKTNEIPDPS